MAIDTSILTRARPLQLENPVNRMAQVLQIQGMQDQQKMNALKTQEYQDGLARKNKLMETLGGQYAKPEEREEALLRSGFVDEAAKLTKNRVDSLKVQADTDKNKVEAAHKRVAAWGQGMGFVRQAPTAENAVATVQHLVNMGVMPEEQGQRHLAQIQSDPSPQAIARWAEMGFRAALDTKEQLTKFQTNNIGGQTVTQGIDPVTGKASTVSAIQNTQSPDNAASNARMAADAAASRAVQIRGQNLTDARSRESASLQREGLNVQREAARTEVKETSDGFVLVDKGTGAVRPLLGSDGKQLGPKLKDAPPAVQSAVLTNAQNLSRAERALQLIEGNNLGDPAKGGQQGDKEATGIKGFLPNQVLNRIDPKGVDARAAIADLGSLVIHDRSGAAVTAAEFPRLAPFIPTEKDDQKTAKKKLQRFVQVYREEMNAMQNAYNPSTGYRPPGGGAAPTGNQPTVTNW